MRSIRLVVLATIWALIVVACSTDESSSVVAIGDSTPAGFGVGSALAYPALYGEILASDLRQEVTVANHSTGQERTVSDWAELVRTDEGLIADLAEADVTLIWLGWHDIMPIVYLKSALSWPDPMRDQLVEKNTELVVAWENLLDAVREAVPPETTVLVADTGIPTPVIEEFSAESFWPELKQLAYLDWRDVLVDAASTHDAIVVPSWTALNGPDGETNARPEFASADNLHLNEEGQRFLAELHRQHDRISS